MTQRTDRKPCELQTKLGHCFCAAQSLDQLVNHGQVPIDDQHRGRLADIVLPLSSNCHGIYESLHGFSNGAKLTDAIKARCRSVFGTPGYRLVCKIYQDENRRSAAKDYVANRRKSYIRIIDKKYPSVSGRLAD